MKILNFHDQVTTNPSDQSSIQLDVPNINWHSDYVKSQVGPKNVVLTSLRTPIDAPKTVRFSVTPVGNVYTNSGVDPSYQLPQKRGVSVLGQVTRVITVTDNTDPTFRVDLPFSAHLVFRTPLISYLTEAQILSLIMEVPALFFDMSQTYYDTDEPDKRAIRLSQLLRGAVIPQI